MAFITAEITGRPHAAPSQFGRLLAMLGAAKRWADLVRRDYRRRGPEALKWHQVDQIWL